MRCHLLSNLHVLAFVALTLAGSFLGLASFAQADPTSAELRVDVFSPAMRWSTLRVPDPSYGHATRSLHFSPGLEVRIFPNRSQHGLLIGGQYRWDTDMDSLFDESGGRWDTDFALARVGYAYRILVPSKRRPDMGGWAFTPHVSLTAGASSNNFTGFNGPQYNGWTPIIGGRAGFDIDFYIGRFFTGWSISYEGLKHLSDSPLGSSHFVSWNMFPLLRFGVTFGPKPQELMR